ncbi:MAG: hypothetical protein WBV22_08930 [Anaerolineaceae bacterium]
MNPKPAKRVFLIYLLGSLLFSACSFLPDKPDPAELTATAIALTPTVTPVTPTPLPPLAILIAPQGSDQTLAGELETSMKGLSTTGGMRFQVRPSLTTTELTPDMAIVAAISPDPGLAALAQAAPETQFVAIGINDITAGDNLSLIRSQSYDAESLAFIAGYIAGVITPDWRAGILLPADQTSAASLLQGFSNGLHFWCGLCQPAYAPFVVYPQSAQIANPADAVTSLSTVDTLNNMGVQTIYVPPEVSTTALLEYIAQKQGMIIGTSQPPASVAGQWVVTLHSGSPVGSFETLWVDLMDGKGGVIIDVPLELTDIGSGLLGESRQRVIRDMLVELSSGLIFPGLVPD